MTIGKLYVSVGGIRTKVGPLWLPDGLDIWWGNRGLHVYWSSSPYMPRLSWDRVEPAPSSEGDR